MSMLRHLRVAKTILMTDFKAFKPVIFDKVIDMIIWTTLTLWVSAYILPKMGIQAEYGVFMLGAMIGTVGVFETFPTIYELMFDFERGKITHYYATLPLPTWMVFARLVVYYSCVCLFLASLVMPISLPLLWGLFSLASVNWLQFVAIFFVANIFYGAFGLFITSLIKHSSQSQHMWIRLIFPLWFLGGFNFSWDSLYATSPWFSYVNLLNPIMHVTEAYRTAITGASGSLPFWISVVYVVVLTFVISVIAIKRLKKRLDFI